MLDGWRVLRRLKQKREARTSLQEAAQVFGALGAEPWAARAHDEVRRTAARAAPDGLSETELRIATSRVWTLRECVHAMAHRSPLTARAVAVSRSQQ